MTSILNQHPDVILRGQIFKDDPDYQRQLQEEVGMLPFTGQLFDDEIESRQRFDRLQDDPAGREPRNAAAVAESFYRGQALRTTARQVGIKFHGGTLYDDEVRDIFLGQQPYDFIVLHRENLLAAGISWYQARTLNQWVKRPGDSDARPPLTVDIGALTGFVERTHQDVADWRRMLAEYGKPYLELTYEQITGPDFDYALVWDHLGVRHIPTPPPKSLKIIKSYDHITNLAEVRAAFAGRGFGQL